MIVLDTNVLSEVMKPVPSRVVAAWMLREHRSGLHTTAPCEAEIRVGIEILADGKRKYGLQAAASQVLGLFAGRILPFDSAASHVFARIVAERRRVGRPFDDFDAQIAAITLSRGMRLATRNVADFAGIGLTVIDPWRDGRP